MAKSLVSMLAISLVNILGWLLVTGELFGQATGEHVEQVHICELTRTERVAPVFWTIYPQKDLV